MANDNQYTEASIDAYLWDDMAPEERRAFEARLEADPGLRRAFELRKAIREGYRRERLRRETREKIQLARRQSRARQWWRRWWALGVILLALAVAAGWWYWGGDKNDGQSEKPPSSEQPVAGSQEGQEEEELLGQGGTGTALVPIQRAVVRDGRLQEVTPAGSQRVAILAGPRKQAQFGKEALVLYFPEGQAPGRNAVRVAELIVDGKAQWYVGIEGQYFPLEEGDNELVEEGNESIIQWLKQLE
ncbi:MAG: hypothetical protein J5I98_08960 [Phaeodactylibacter sp.]|nr:hypothetical protein [Phaeodactylibacter sp.]